MKFTVFVESPKLINITSENAIQFNICKVNLSLQQTVEAHNVVGRRGSHIF
jgi:hypothetical protein